MASRLVPHVKKNLHPFQHGFQKGKSCLTQLLEIFNDIGFALDRGLESDIIYLDFAKAFDSVCPAKLVAKLKTFGIDDPLLSWLYSYLTGRRQRVVINGTFSNWTDVGSGVPQGSLLGPILFQLFVNDMPNVINSATMAMFADGSKCYRILNNDADFLNLQQDLFSLTTWSLSNELNFQPIKSAVICVYLGGVSSPCRSYSINGNRCRACLD